MIKHSCPRCGAIDENITKHPHPSIFDFSPSFCKGDDGLYYLHCEKCGYDSTTYTKANQLDLIWPKKSGLMEIFDRISRTLDKAEKKHPKFAEGQYEALGYLGEEYGEVTKEVTKGKQGWEQRMDSELYDLIAVAIRMLRREYE